MLIYTENMKYLTPVCDNVREAHLIVEKAGVGGIRAYCKICNRYTYLRTNKNGAPDKRQANKLYYRDIVQPSHPLYFKIHPQKMKLAL